jgi:hypothetical protein
MLKRLIILAAVAALAVLVLKSVPDLRRYRKIRSM